MVGLVEVVVEMVVVVVGVVVVVIGVVVVAVLDRSENICDYVSLT